MLGIVKMSLFLFYFIFLFYFFLVFFFCFVLFCFCFGFFLFYLFFLFCLSSIKQNIINNLLFLPLCAMLVKSTIFLLFLKHFSRFPLIKKTMLLNSFPLLSRNTVGSRFIPVPDSFLLEPVQTVNLQCYKIGD